MNNNTPQKREDKNDSLFNDISGSENCKQPFFRRLIRWTTTTIPGFFTLIGVLLVGVTTIAVNITETIEGAESWCKVSCIFPWCDECGSIPPDDEPIKLARKLFADNSANNLQVTINPIPPLNVDREISLHITNNSDKDGYFLAFSIDSEGQLFSLISEISKRLELQYILAYLQINQGETVIIPQEGVPDDPLAGIRTGDNVGQALLVVILVDKLLLEPIDILLLESEEVQPVNVLENLYQKLESPVEDEIGGTYSLQWSSLVVDYEIVSSQQK